MHFIIFVTLTNFYYQNWCNFYIKNYHQVFKVFITCKLGQLLWYLIRVNFRLEKILINLRKKFTNFNSYINKC